MCGDAGHRGYLKLQSYMRTRPIERRLTARRRARRDSYRVGRRGARGAIRSWVRPWAHRRVRQLHRRGRFIQDCRAFRKATGEHGSKGGAFVNLRRPRAVWGRGENGPAWGELGLATSARCRACSAPIRPPTLRYRRVRGGVSSFNARPLAIASLGKREGEI